MLGSFRRTQQHCAEWLLSHPGRCYPMIRIHPSREVETPPLLSGAWISDVNIRGGKYAAARCNGGAHPGAHGGSRVCSYLDMWAGRPPMVYPDALSGYTPCMDSKELSSISYCFSIYIYYVLCIQNWFSKLIIST